MIFCCQADEFILRLPDLVDSFANIGIFDNFKEKRQ